MEPTDRRPLLLHAIDAYVSRLGTGPTVRELAADLGIPEDFGHHQLVDRLQRELARGRVSLYRGRFTLTAVGRLALEGRLPARLQPEPSSEPVSSMRVS